MNMTRATWTATVILVGAFLVSATAVSGRDAADAGKLVSLTASPSAGKEETMYTVPSRSRLLVTQACVQHTAMVIEFGENDERLTYGARGCTHYKPGFVVASGQSISCENDSGLERTCALTGVLEELPARKGPRVRFYDLK